MVTELRQILRETVEDPPAGDEIGVEFLARRISTVARPVVEVPV